MSIVPNRCCRWALINLLLFLSLVVVPAWVIPSPRVSIERGRQRPSIASPLFEKRPKDKESTVHHETDVPITTATVTAPRSFPTKASSASNIKSSVNTTTATATPTDVNVRNNATAATETTLPLKAIPKESAETESSVLLETVEELPKVHAVEVEAAESTPIEADANDITTGAPVILIPSKDESIDDNNNLLFEEEATSTETNEEDVRFMQIAIELAQLDGGERGPRSAYPNPTVGALLVSANGTIVGRGRSDYRTEAVRACLQDAGLSVTPLQEWVVDSQGEEDAITTLGPCTLYTTLEPSTRRRGTAMPPITHLIRAAAPIVRRIVIGCPSPVPEKAHLGAQFLHQAGLEVHLMDARSAVRAECEALITDFTASANGKLQRQARKHFQLFGRPLGFLHCSVIHSDNVEAFRRHGNAFGTTFGPSTLSYRNFGAYELAPPPDVIWATEEDERSSDMMTLDTTDDDDDDDDEFVTVNFEDYQETSTPLVSPMMPWYHQVDAVVATFPRSGNGPPNDDSVRARLAGLVWLATYGQELPAGVERILVLDATELPDLPLTNDDPNLPAGGEVDIEAFWAGRDRKATRVLLRRGVHAAARAAAQAAARAAQSAADAARSAMQALESGNAADYAAAAKECARTATAAQVYLQEELERTQVLRVQLESLGVIVESLEGGEPVDVMQHLGERNGLYSVVWRAGCWGDRGVRAILAGAFQWVSAHLAVPADGGRFWQLMMAENAVQAACGPQSKVKVFADQDDISMEYCDNVGDDEDCVLSVEGKPIRHVRLDCRVALVDAERPREFDIAKTQKINRKVLVEQAPWFL